MHCTENIVHLMYSKVSAYRKFVPEQEMGIGNKITFGQIWLPGPFTEHFNDLDNHNVAN